MRPRGLILPLLSLGVAAGALAGGCGSSTKTVSATSPPSASASSTATTGRSTTTAPPTPAPATTRTAPTRTASTPAFTKEEGGGEAASAAVALVRSKGYTPNDAAEYHDNQTLRVLVATRTGSGDGYGQLAFFFEDGRYLGTDTKEASAKVKVVSQSDTEVMLAYPLYSHSDPLSSPSGGQTTVRFQLDNGKLTALGKIPPVNAGKGYSRY